MPSSDISVPLVPRPRKLTNRRERITLSAEAVILADELFLPIATELATRLRKATGWKWDVLPSGTVTNQQRLVIRREPHEHRREAYSLRTDEQILEITAGHEAGAFYGGRTFLQLLPPAIFGHAPLSDVSWTLPSVEIEDWPEFQWRGVMLDSVRHFQPVPYLKKFIDVLAQHKINVLHWHLTDDQGWRIEILKYPELTRVGSRRRESPIGHHNAKAGGDGEPVEGYYRQEEIRELVEYARLRNVSILPEIEMPGHAQAAVAAYPRLGCLATPAEVSTNWGIHETLFNIQPETISFLQDVLEEVIGLFPFEYIHVGGDEAVKTQWRNNPATQQRMKELGVPDENHLQSWFIRQMADFLSGKGRKLVGWDEILEGGLPACATVMSWRGEQGAIEAARLGHDAVMCTHGAYYFDYSQSQDHTTESLSIGGWNSLRKTYESHPIPESLTPAQAERIIGVQGQLWTEYIPTTSRLEYMAFPRVCALAEVAWSSPQDREFGDFIRRLSVHVRRLDCQDIRYRAGFAEEAIAPSSL